MSTTNDTVIQYFDPSDVLADDNSRYKLLPAAIQKLADDIQLKGEVMVPVEVEQLNEPVNGKSYRLVTGHYRHAAVSLLNESGAGLALPAIVVEQMDPVDRLKRQISENEDRQNLSPIDKAISIKRLMDAGVSRKEICEIFASSGGRKGSKVQPASNAHINMTLSFLELPKKVIGMIHTGEIGVGAAYELTRVSPERRDVVIESALAERDKADARDAADEAKLQAAEQKVAEAEATVEATNAELEAARVAKETAEAEVESANTAEMEAYKATKAAIKAKDEEAKAAAEEALKLAKANAKEAEKAVEKATKEFTKLETKVQTLAETVAERRRKLEEASKVAKVGNKKAVSRQDVSKAAVKEGASNNYVALNAAEMRKVIADMALPAGEDAVSVLIEKIGKEIKACFDGVSTDTQMFKRLKNMLTATAKKAA